MDIEKKVERQKELVSAAQKVKKGSFNNVASFPERVAAASTHEP